MNFQSEPLKTFIVLLLYFIGWWGWFALFFLTVFDALLDRWYIVLPIFVFTCWSGFFMRGVAERFRRSGNG
jgi:hypothetical protein